MKRIEWENYQDGDSTPLNAENLNLMQDNIEEAKADKKDYIQTNDEYGSVGIGDIPKQEDNSLTVKGNVYAHNVGAEIIIDGNRIAVKYADGRLECSGTILATNTPIETARGNLFGSATIPGDDYLESFIMRPELVFSAEQNASTKIMVDVHPAIGFGTINKTCDFVLSATATVPGYSDTNTAPRIHYIAKGFWK